MGDGSRPEGLKALLRPTLTREIGLILFLLACVTLVLAGAALFIAHPEAVRARDSFQSMRFYLWSAGGAAVLLLAVGLVMTHFRVAAPIKRVAAAARDLANGDLSRRVGEEDFFGELGELASAFDAMAARVQSTVDNLEMERDFSNALLEAFPEGVAVYGPGDTLPYANPAFQKLFPGEAWREAYPCLKGGPCRLGRRVDLLPPVVPRPSHLRVNCVMLAGRILLTAEDETEAVIGRRQKAEWQDMLIHDVKSPLSAVLGTVKALRMEEQPEYEKSLLDMADSAGARVLGLLNTYLEVLRMESGSRSIEKAPVSLLETARTAVESVAPLADREKVAVTVDVPPGAVLNADKELLLRMLINLLDNSIKYGAPRWRSRLRAVRKDGGWVLEVADEGQGIEAADLPFVFHRFYRARVPGGGERAAGTGLGLSFCRLACELHGWKIRAESVVGEGTRMVIEIPPEAPDAAA